jgi:hypothetical protein
MNRYTAATERTAWRLAVFTTGGLLFLGSVVEGSLPGLLTACALLGWPAVAHAAVLVERAAPRQSARPPIMVPATLSPDDLAWLARQQSLVDPEPEVPLVPLRRSVKPVNPDDYINVGKRRAIEREAEMFGDDPAERARLREERLAREAEQEAKRKARAERSRAEYAERLRQQQEQDRRIAAQIDAAAALHRHRVVAWQREHGLTPDGIVGPKTRLAMQAALEGAETVVEAVESSTVDSLLLDLGIEPECRHEQAIDCFEWSSPRCAACGRDVPR